MANGPVRIGLSFDDVLLVPQRSAVAHRGDIDTSVTLAPSIELQVPIVSANTPWCTEAPMAIEMARCGGLGFVHRMCTIDAQAAAIAEVKAAACDRDGFPAASRDARGRLLVGAAVGANGDWRERAEALVAAGADLLVLDIAHGHADHALDAVDGLRCRHPETTIVAGNVATRQGVRDLVAAGATILKVGIGPGSVCTTRLVTGAGVPQLTAVLDCAAEAAEHGATVIADGGIRTSGDIVKALAAGASAVMLGGLLAGASESAGLLVEDGGEKFKVTTGFATLGARITLKRAQNLPVSAREVSDYVPEGVEATFPYRGPVERVLHELVGGLRSGCSYCGVSSVRELANRAEFIQVTAAARQESQPHALAPGRRQLHRNFRDMVKA